jgi:hypothetical protein
VCLTKTPPTQPTEHPSTGTELIFRYANPNCYFFGNTATAAVVNDWTNKKKQKKKNKKKKKKKI